MKRSRTGGMTPNLNAASLVYEQVEPLTSDSLLGLFREASTAS